MKQAEVAMFLKSVREICPELTDFELSQFASLLTFKELNKKEFFLQTGKIQNCIGYIIQGLVRAYSSDHKGNQINVAFYAEGEYATHYPAFNTRQPSQYTIQCLESTKFLCLSYANQQLVYQQHPTFERYGRLVAEEVLKRQQARIESFIFQTAEQRYLQFIKNNPNLFHRISISHLCSFLGIERQTLTRIRQKLAHSRF